MAVIINEFEVAVEPPEETAVAGTPSTIPPPSPLAPQDIDDIIYHQAERAARIRAD